MSRHIAAIVRHGEYNQLPDVPSAHQPFSLTDEGREQAESGARELLETLKENGWSIDPTIDCSQMLRAWQTAQVVSEVCGATTLESFDALAERGLGCAANLTIAQIEDILGDDPRHAAPPPNWKSDSHYRLPLQGAESLLEAGHRVAGHMMGRMSELTDSGGGGKPVKIFVGHGAALRHAAFHLGVLKFEQIAGLSMHHGRPVFLETATDGPWRHVAGKWKVRHPGDQARD